MQNTAKDSSSGRSTERQGRERPMPNTAKNSSSAGEITEEFGSLNALMNSLLPPGPRNDTTVVAGSIQNNYACFREQEKSFTTDVVGSIQNTLPVLISEFYMN